MKLVGGSSFPVSTDLIGPWDGLMSALKKLGIEERDVQMLQVGIAIGKQQAINLNNALSKAAGIFQKGDQGDIGLVGPTGATGATGVQGLPGASGSIGTVYIDYIDNEIPSGTIDGTNDTFTLSRIPSPWESLQLVLNGVTMRPMVDYTIGGNTIVYVPGHVPTSISRHWCWYLAGTSEWIYNADLSGVIDDSNDTFILPAIPANETSVQLFLDGLLLQYGTDFSIAAGTTTLTYDAIRVPATKSHHWITYQRTAPATQTIRYEAPAGTIDGANAIFTLSVAPNPPASLVLVRNLVVQEQGVDYTLTGDTIKYETAKIPLAGTYHWAWYRTTP
jgi:hypothetical protein